MQKYRYYEWKKWRSHSQGQSGNSSPAKPATCWNPHCSIQRLPKSISCPKSNLPPKERSAAIRKGQCPWNNTRARNNGHHIEHDEDIGESIERKWRSRGLTQPGCDACLYTRPQWSSQPFWVSERDRFIDRIVRESTTSRGEIDVQVVLESFGMHPDQSVGKYRDFVSQDIYFHHFSLWPNVTKEDSDCILYVVSHATSIEGLWRSLFMNRQHRRLYKMG